MTTDEKVAAFDAIAEAFTNRFADGTWAWWNPSPACGAEHRRKSRPQAVADLVAFAFKAQARNRKKWTELAIAACHPEEQPVSEPSRYTEGGFTPRFIISRADGQPCRPEARYMVLDGSGADPHAVKALQTYANSVRADNPTLAADLDRMLATGAWPADLAQHKDAR